MPNEKDQTRYEFGANWVRFIQKHFSEERLQIAQRCMLEMQERKNLEGEYFLDVGCGSGLHSLAALRAGAERVVSFDLDPQSVATARLLRQREGNPEHWSILQGSILDNTFLERLDKASLVYAWGVLHHTGSMWEALDNTIDLVAPGGCLFLALYDTDMLAPSGEFWASIKRRYNRAGYLGRLRLEAWYMWNHIFKPIFNRGGNPLKAIYSYSQSRGMAFYTDVKDWLGGYPFEYATAAEVTDYVKNRHGMDLEKLKTGDANSQYIFRQQNQSSRSICKRVPNVNRVPNIYASPSNLYLRWDKKICEDIDKVTPETLSNYINGIQDHPAYNYIEEINSFSMLHVATLMLLRLLAQASKGGILEIGPYIGGSTLAIASGIGSQDNISYPQNQPHKAFVSIEMGGKYPDHPHCPSNDIFADLNRNIQRYGYSSYVNILEGFSNDPTVIVRTHELLSKEGVGLFFVDADGLVDRDMAIYHDIMLPGCIIVCDDYESELACDKAENVKNYIHEQVKNGKLETLGVFPWSTWFGRYIG